MNLLPNWMIDMVNKENNDLKETYNVLEREDIDVENNRQNFAEISLSAGEQTKYLKDKYSQYFS